MVLLILEDLLFESTQIARVGGYSIYPWVGRCGLAPHTLILFKTNITDFPTLFKTELRFLIPCLRHLKLLLQEVVWLSCCVINGNSICLVSIRKSTEFNINQQELVKILLFIVQEKISCLQTDTLIKTKNHKFDTLFKTKIPKNIPWLAARPH